MLVWGVLASASLAAQPVLTPTAVDAGVMGIERWLLRMHDSAHSVAYVGTFVVTAGSFMSSSRIWHVGDGQQQMERVEALTGDARSTFRRNDDVVTYLHNNHTVIQENREALGLFPNLHSRPVTSVAHFYSLKSAGRGRVAGLQADVVQLVPIDRMRFGYQIWTEQKTGMVLKLQTLDASHRVLEQAAFSELQLDAPVQMAKLQALMENTQGYQIHTQKRIRTTAEQEGWKAVNSVSGFVPLNCYKREEDTGAAGPPLQCIFSDGLASVSLFFEVFDSSRHARLQQHESLDMGATHMRVRQLGNWWLTAVGEVPNQTLTALVQAFERKQ
jgi:sigma-E factor negative regulatory protein RseB